MLDFQNFVIFMADKVERVKMHHRAKLYMAIGQSIAEIWRFLNFWSERSRAPNCVTVPNFVEITLTVADINKKIMAICRFVKTAPSKNKQTASLLSH